MNSSSAEGISRLSSRAVLALGSLAALAVGCPTTPMSPDVTTIPIDADVDAPLPPEDDTGPRPDVGRDVGSDADLDADLDAFAFDTGDAPMPGDACAPLADEVCNGVDDTCDGEIDEGCACRPQPLVRTSDGFHVALARTSNGEIVTAHEELGVAFAVERHGSDLAPIGDTIELVRDDERLSSDLALFALGADVGALWRQWPSASSAADEPTFARVDAASASRAVGPLSLAPDMGGPLGQSGVAFGAGFAIARQEMLPLGGGVGVRLFSRAGVATAGPTPLLEDRSVAYTAIGAVGDVLGVAYQANTGADPFEIRFVRFDDGANAIGASIALGAGVRPRIASQATGWGVIWENGGAVMFASLTATGTIARTARTIAMGSARGASIAADGDGGWAIVHRTDVGTRFVHLAADGSTLGEAISPDGFYVDGIDVLALDDARFVTVGIASAESAFWIPCEIR